MRGVPHIVDDDKAVLLIQSLSQVETRILDVHEDRALARQRSVQLRQCAQDIGALAQRDPEDTVVVCVYDVVIMADSRCHRGLS